MLGRACFSKLCIRAARYVTKAAEVHLAHTPRNIRTRTHTRTHTLTLTHTHSHSHSHLHTHSYCIQASVTLARVHKEHYKAAKVQLAAQPKSKQFDFDEQVGCRCRQQRIALIVLRLLTL